MLQPDLSETLAKAKADLDAAYNTWTEVDEALTRMTKALATWPKFKQAPIEG